MKLTNTKTNKSKKGMTLIELTVVILVLLSLISVLFIGARAWLRGSDRAAAAILIRNAQQGLRSQTNIVGLDTPLSPDDGGVPYDYATEYAALTGSGPTTPLANEIFAPGGFVEVPLLDIGTPPTHPDQGNAFLPETTYNDVQPLTVLYLTSQDNAEFFKPNGVQ